MDRKEQTNKRFSIGQAAKLAQVHPQTLRYYERMGILKPARSKGNVRFYNLSDLEKIKRIRFLTQELGVNLAGVEIIMKLSVQVEQLKQEKEQLERKLQGELTE
ncbi:MAG: MerR family transcriptional regulator, heat shock protein HspR [Candidatus Atribacteria bacterium]|nr:MerR family transcriptional regulator, heat shock protein HspR [Candidatus Atribacteria bacterium]